MILTGVDVSRYQGVMDWQKALTQGVRYAVLRATAGDYYTDPLFVTNWLSARAAGLPLAAYHVVTPADSYGRKISAGAQMDYFFSVALPLIPDLPLVLDCELSRGATPTAITALIRECGILINQRTGLQPFIYTSAGWWNPNVKRQAYWKEYPLWVANYTTAAQPILPADWTTWVMWQYSADGNGLGPTYGAQSTSIDLNRLDTVQAARFGIVIPEIPGEIPEIVRVKTNLIIRRTPSVYGLKQGTAVLGSIWYVLGVAKDTKGRDWYKIAEGAYLASWYCERVT